MRILSVVVVLVCALASAPLASANTGGGPPGDGPGGDTSVTRTLTVTAPATGSITGTGIDCPGDCTESFTYDLAEDPPTVRLTATRSGSGWSPDWSDNCTVVSGACDITMSSIQTVSVGWDDVAPPSVYFYSATGIMGPNRGVSVPASDNAGVSRVEFYVGDATTPAATDSSLPYGASLSALGLESLAHGDTATIRVIAEDTSGNRSHTLATAPAALYTVDRETSLTGVTVPPAYTRDAPSIAFVSPADAADITCQTRKNGLARNPFSPCWSSPYQAEIDLASPEGSYTAELKLRDNASNTATVTRTFVIDRTAPGLSITGGPAQGAVVNDTSQSFNFTSGDANPYTLECRLDTGAFGPCSGPDSHALNGLGAGDHTFTVRAMDGAGNATVASRSFSVASALQTGTDRTDLTGTDVSTAGTPTGGGSESAGNSNGTGTTPGASADGVAQPLAVAARSTPRFSVRAGKTQVRKLVLTGLAKGAKIQLACKGRGCAFKKKKLTAKGSRVDLAKLFKKRRLAAKTRIDVRVAFGDGSVRTFRYTTQKGKKRPKVVVLDR